MDSISDRLKALGVQLGTANISAPKQPKQVGFGIESVVDGVDYATIYGSAFVTRKLYPTEYQHGVIHIANRPNLQAMSEWGKAAILNLSPDQIVFLDTETSGLAGGTGTYVFLVGLGYLSESGFQLIQVFLRDPSQEAAFLATLLECLDPFKAVVTFNGKTFDLPMLNTRLTLNGMTSPFVQFDHLDMLQLSRRLWRDRLASRALGDLEKEILHFYRDLDEVPGYLIPEYYFNYLRTGDARPLGGVFYHNALDIVSLAALFNHLSGVLAAPTEQDIPSLDIVAVARLFEDMGRYEDAAILFERGLNQGLPEEFFVKTIQRFAMLRRKQSQWENAVVLYEKAFDHGDYTSLVEIEKYFEHTLRDPLQALDWVIRGLDQLEQSSLPGYLYRNWKLELEHRQERLERKINKQRGSFSQG